MRQKSGIKLRTILIGMIMFISILPAIILKAHEANEVTYLDEHGIEKICNNYTLVNSTQGDAVWGITGQTTWYAVIGSVSITGQVTLYGDVHLILCDGASLTVIYSGSAGMCYGKTGDTVVEAHLSVYGQSNGKNTGKLKISAGGHGIVVGNFKGPVSGSVTINGGAIDVTASTRGAGILGYSGVTINGGTVKASAAGDAAIRADNGDIIINGGSVDASAVDSFSKGIFADTVRSKVIITGGDVTASGQRGIQAGTVMIKGGVVTADGLQYGIETVPHENYPDNRVAIEDGNVTCTGGQNAINGPITHFIVGRGWANAEGTQGEEDIPVCLNARKLQFLKANFIPYAVITNLPTAGGITYGQTLASSTLAGGSANVEGNFKWKDSTFVPAVSDSQKTEYDVIFTPTG